MSTRCPTARICCEFYANFYFKAVDILVIPEYDIAQASEETGTVLKKSGKWYADWRDATGKRHRKGFRSKDSAIRYQNAQSRDAQSKKAPASVRLAR